MNSSTRQVSCAARIFFASIICSIATTYGQESLNLAALKRLDSGVSIQNTRVSYNRSTRQTTVTTTVTNTSSTTIAAPIYLVVESVHPAGITCANADGLTTDAKPYFQMLASGHLAAGGTLSEAVAFANPNRVAITFSAAVYAAGSNSPPQITSTAVTAATEGVAYSYDVQATDADSDPLSYVLTTAPSGMTIDPSTGLIGWTPSGTQAGSHAVTVQVSDGRGGTDSQSFTITVSEAVNNPPEITSTAVTAATEGVAYSYDVEATDPDSDALTYALTTAPIGMVIDASTGLIQWTPATIQVGVHDVVVQASDGRGGSDTQSFQVNVASVVGPDYVKPAVDAVVSPSVANVEDPVTIAVTASDNVGVTSVELKVNGVVVPLVGGVATYTSATPGVFTAVATALDAAGNEGLDREEFHFLVPGDTTPPTVAISTPAANSKLTGPTDIVGTASDLHLVRYLLEYSPKDRNEFVTFATGTSSVTGGVLGRLDATMMRNGLCDVRLTAEDQSGNIASVTRAYQLDGEMKVGNFTMTFNDLTIPMAGMPITVSRTYDSRVKSKGDFGVAWTLDVKDIELSESCVMGEDWQQTRTGGMLPWYIISSTKSHAVTVTFPDGRVDEFDATISPDRQQLIPLFNTTMSFTPRAGTLSSLVDPTGSGVDLYVNGGAPGPVELLDWATFAPYDPSRYRLTDKEGTVYAINQASGLESITDRNGNTITFGAGGIIHSAGKSIVFTRDAQGRIIAITDPLGNVVQYQYDYYGDLVAVIDQVGNRTTFRYNSEHGLVDIIDPRGLGVARNIYDDDGRLIAIVDAEGNRVEFTHNVGTRQEVTRDRLGNVTVYDYDTNGNVVSKTDALGHTTAYTYDARGNKLTETDPLGHTTTHTYDARDNMLTETDPLGNTTTYTYSTSGQVLTARDPLGNTTTNVYNASGNLTSTTDPLGNATAYTYDAAGNMLTETNPLGHTTTFTYDGYGNMTSQTDPYGNTTTYTYDDNGNRLTETRTRTTWTGTETMVTRYAYDGMNRLIQTTDALGNISRTEYNAIGKESARIDPLGRRTQYEYNARGNLVRTDYPDGTSETVAYDAENRKICATDRAGRITRYTYDNVGNLIRTTFPDGSFTRTEYDAAGRAIRQIDQRGNVTTYEYDAAGRNTAVTDALGNRTQYAYDGNGNRTSMTDANGNVTLSEYDALNRLFRTTYPDATTAVTTYDAAGRRIAETDQAGRTTQFAYDALGRLIRVTDALGGVTQYAYDEAGNRVTQTDANGNTTSFAYDSLGRQIGRRLPLGQIETMSYDAAGNMVSKTDFNGQTIPHVYNVNNQLVRKDFVGGAWTGFTYTPVGQRATEVKSTGETTSYAYDVMDRLLSRTDPDSRTISYTYDAAGNRTSVVTPAGTTTYTFDALNRMATVTDPDSGVTQYTYDAVGNRAAVAYPNGMVAQYAYDNLNRLTNLLNRTSGGATISSYAYTLGPAGNRTRVVEDSGRTVDYAYDALYRLTQERITVAGETTTIDYSYDPVGNRLRKTETATAHTVTTNYAYDQNDRLLTETVAVTQLRAPEGEVQYAYATFARPSGATPWMSSGFFGVSFLFLLIPFAITWAADGSLGHRSRRQRNCLRALCVFMIPLFVLGGDNVWAVNREAMLYEALMATGVTQPGVTAYSYAYDSNGNTTSRTNGTGTDTYTYDHENRLASANVELGGTPGPVSYTYDADGIRTSKTTGAGTTSYLVDKNLPFAQVLVETTDATAVSYVHGDDLISMKRPTGTSYYHYDGQMSTRQLTNPAQVATDTYTYDAFGVELSHAGPTLNDYKYTGEQYDANIGFYYLRARFYNGNTGRFVTADPFSGTLFDPTSLHKYLYAHANPVMNIDPTGQFSLIGLAITSVIVGILASISAGIYYAILGETKANIFRAMLTWFFIGAIAGAIVYSCVWLFAYLATQMTVAGGLGAPAIQQILQNQQRLMHAFHRHWQGILGHWNELRPIVERVLSNPQVVQNGVRLGADRATVYAAQVPVNGVTQWVSVAIFETGPLAGQLATAVTPTAQQLAQAGL